MTLGPPIGGGAGGTMTPGPMDFRGPMGFRGAMSSRGAHRNDTDESVCEALRPFFFCFRPPIFDRKNR